MVFVKFNMLVYSYELYKLTGFVLYNPVHQFHGVGVSPAGDDLQSGHGES